MPLPTYQYSGTVYTGITPGTLNFPLTTVGGQPIPFLEGGHIHVYRTPDDGATLVELTRPAQWDFNTAKTAVVLVTALDPGNALIIQRQTPSNKAYIEFAEGTLLTANQLNLAETWGLYVLQEAEDDFSGAAANVIGTAATAEANAAQALSTANTAASNASTALSTANTAASNASTAVSTASTANSTANAASSTANAANDKADAAIAAIASSVSYTGVANVAAIPGAPANNTYIEVLDATGLESFTPLTGIPVGFVGDSGLKVRLRYTTVGNTWVWIDYSAKDADGRYVQETSISTSTSSSSTTTVASSSAVKAAKDAADAAQSTADGAASTASAAQSAASAAQSAANTANATADAALPKAGGTMTGAITFAGAQTFPAASTSSPGVVQLSTANNSTSTTQAATPSAVKSVQDFAQVVSNTANAALPKAGGTMTGAITFAGAQTFPAASTSAAGVVQLSTSTSSTSTTLAATPSAVKSVQDFAQTVNTTANAAMPKTGGTFTGDIAVPSINGGPLAGMRNAIINGNFDIWQRGTSFTESGYGADRWTMSRTGTTCTMSRQAFTPGQTDVPGEPQYFCRMAVSSVANAANRCLIIQAIEGVRTFAGQQVTISFWAKADASKTIAIELFQSFGTGGSPSAAIDGIGVVKKTLTSSWQKITHTATLPSIAGKTIGSNGDDRFSLNIWLDAGSNFNSRTDTLGQQSGTFDIAQVQVEAGPVATPFERRPIGVELALCQRYYQTVAIQALATGGRWYAASANTSYNISRFALPVPMRGNPTVGASTGFTTSNIASLTINAEGTWIRMVATPSGTGEMVITGGTAAPTTLDAEL